MAYGKVKVPPGVRPNVTDERNPRNIAIHERRRQVLQLKLSGATNSMIAQTLGIRPDVVPKDIEAELHQRAKENRKHRERLVALELARTEALLLGVWDQAIGGNARAVEVALKVLERRAKYLGLDAPTKIQPVDENGASIPLYTANSITIVLDDDGNEVAHVPARQADAIEVESRRVDENDDEEASGSRDEASP